MNDNKDEVIAALQEMVNELTAKLINLRVNAGLKIKELEAKIAENDEKPARPKLVEK